MPDIFDQVAQGQPRLNAQLPPSMMTGGRDIFDDLAGTGRPDFAANPPGMPKAPNPIEHDEGGRSDLPDLLGDAATQAGKFIYQRSTPGIATSLLQRKAPSVAGALPDVMTKNALPLNDVPVELMKTAPMMIGDDVPPQSRPSLAQQVAPAADSGGGMGSRLMDVMKRRAGRIPGVQAAKDFSYVVGGGDAPAPPAAPAPSVPPEWGKGQYGTPVSQWGQRVPPPSTAEPPIPPEPQGAIRRPSLRDAMRADAQETKGIQAQARETGEQEDRARLMNESRRSWAANTVDTPKATRIEQANANRQTLIQKMGGKPAETITEGAGKSAAPKPASAKPFLPKAKWLADRMKANE